MGYHPGFWLRVSGGGRVLQPFVVFNLVGRGLVLLGALLNARLYGMKLVSLGAFLNFLVIALNGGKMPVSLKVTSWLGSKKAW